MHSPYRPHDFLCAPRASSWLVRYVMYLNCCTLLPTFGGLRCLLGLFVCFSNASFSILLVAWRRLTCLSIIANRKFLSNADRQIKQTTGDCRVHSTSYYKGSCLGDWTGEHDMAECGQPARSSFGHGATTAGPAGKNEGMDTEQGRPGNKHQRVLGAAGHISPRQAAMADQLAGGTSSCSGLGVHWMGHGGQAPARTGIGRISKRGGLMRMPWRRPAWRRQTVCAMP